MLSVRHISECPEDEQATLPAYLRGPDAIIIKEARPGEANEPRNFIRRAIYTLKGKVASRNVEMAFLKADALMLFGCAVAVSTGCWSPTSCYDPLPDFRELQQRAMRLMAQSADEGPKAFLKNLADYVRYLEGHPSAAGAGV